MLQQRTFGMPFYPKPRSSSCSSSAALCLPNLAGLTRQYQCALLKPPLPVAPACKWPAQSNPLPDPALPCSVWRCCAGTGTQTGRAPPSVAACGPRAPAARAAAAQHPLRLLPGSRLQWHQRPSWSTWTRREEHSQGHPVFPLSTCREEVSASTACVGCQHAYEPFASKSNLPLRLEHIGG